MTDVPIGHVSRPVIDRRHGTTALGWTAGVLIGVFALAASVRADEPPAPAQPAEAERTEADTVRAVASALTECPNPLAKRERWSIARVIHEESEQHGYDPLLITALVQVESGCAARARGGGAIGLIQLLPSTAREVARRAGLPWRGAQMLVEPEANLQIGVRYLRQLEEMFDDPHKAVAAYNLGPAPVMRMSAQRAKRMSYVRKVMSLYERLRAQYA
ncbi:MAG: lytic transglycosylase domain-containing protein [Candidatus Binatia bacterium]